MQATSFLYRTFRQSRLFSLCEWTELNEEDQQKLSGLYDIDDVYGLFLPNEHLPHLTAKLVYREIALLYLHLYRPGLLPHCFTATANHALQNSVAQLVLDGVLEMEVNGSFVCASESAKAIYGDRMTNNFLLANHTSRISLNAIAYAYLLYGLDVHQMAMRLYGFYATPWDTGKKTIFINNNSIYDFLLHNADESLKSTLADQWHFNPATKKFAWLAWRKKSAAEENHSAYHCTYKLYISPATEQLPLAFQKAVPVITASKAFCFKTGAFLKSILRPDKMVVYFRAKESLMETALALRKTLFGTPVHGVPFTAQIDDEGLLSWGVDPPQTAILDAVEGGSWRTTVTDQLALAILSAQAANLSWDAALPFIQAKLLTAGINPMDWTMTETTQN